MGLRTRREEIEELGRWEEKERESRKGSLSSNEGGGAEERRE